MKRALSIAAAAALVLTWHPTAALAKPPAPTDPHAKAPTATQRSRAAEEPRHTNPNPLLKEVLGEKDDDRAQEPSAPGALCQSFIGKPNPYRRPAPNIDAITNDGIVQAGTQQGCSTAQNETTIAVNPYNPRNIVAGSNDYRVFNSRENRNDSSGWAYTSFDGGATWTDVQLPHLVFQTGATGALSYFDSAGDPAIAFGPHNTVYYANLVFSRAVPPDGEQQASGLAVSVSHDGGLHWDEPSVLQIDGVTPAGTPTPTFFFNDKEWITADPVSGTVYVTWTRFTFDDGGNYLESPIVVRKSTDFGHSWGAMRRVAPSLTGFAGGVTPFAQGSSPQVGNDGALYVAYETSICETAACDAPDDHDGVVVATSRDGGRTFRNEEVAMDFDFPGTLTGENFRLNSFPMTAYDRVTNQLWITWADDRNGAYDDAAESTRTNGNVFVVGSKHGSSGWSRPTRLGSGADEVFPAVTAFAGRVAVSYYTRAFDPHGIGLDYAYSVGWGSHLDGATLRRITTQTADPQIQFTGTDQDGNVVQGVFIGDYSAIAMGIDFKIHPCWTDFRGRPGTTAPNQDVYTQSISAL